jgi:hypothetical protein
MGIGSLIFKFWAYAFNICGWKFSLKDNKYKGKFYTHQENIIYVIKCKNKNSKNWGCVRQRGSKTDYRFQECSTKIGFITQRQNNTKII